MTPVARAQIVRVLETLAKPFVPGARRCLDHPSRETAAGILPGSDCSGTLCTVELKGSARLVCTDKMSQSGVGCRGPPALLPAPSVTCQRASTPRSVHSRTAMRRLDLRAFCGGRRAALLLRSRPRSCAALARQGPVALLDVTEDTFEAEVLQVGAGSH